MKKLFLVFLVAIVSLMHLTYLNGRQNPPEDFNGYVWLEMNQDQRSSFLWGYLGGLSDGQERTCAALKAPLKWKISELKTCLDSQVTYSKESDFYANQITTFYQKHPQGMRIRILVVLGYLSDQEAKSVEEIYGLVKDRRFP